MCSPWRARANWACRMNGCGAWKNTIRSTGRCSASIGWSPVRRPRRCSMPGDLLLAVDGKVVNRFREVERAVQNPNVAVTVWRDGAEKTLQLKTVALNGRDIDRVLIWAGATLQAPHRAMAAQRGIAPYGVFVSFFFYGSPATHYGLYAGRRITEVDGQPTPDLDAFIKAVSGKPDRASLRLKTISWNGQTDVITLKLDKHYWPAYELNRQEDGSWIRTELDPPEVTAATKP